jgi:hypothetical protein
MTAERFHYKMIIFLNEYRDHLLFLKSNKAVTHHCDIVNEFINYLYNLHLISDLGQITVSIANSKFHNHYKKISKEVVSKESVKNILREFFIFINGKYSVTNETLMKGLKK